MEIRFPDDDSKKRLLSCLDQAKNSLSSSDGGGGVGKEETAQNDELWSAGPGAPEQTFLGLVSRLVGCSHYILYYFNLDPMAVHFF